jgi:hypothetical protein
VGKQVSSFSEEKEAKRLLFSCSFTTRGRDQHACGCTRNKSFFGSFFSKKEQTFLAES